MADKKYTTTTAHLKATVIDTRRINGKQIDVEKIKLKGENIEDLWGFQNPEDFKKLCTRCELPEDKPWSLWTDEGNLVYFNRSEKIVNGQNMFSNQETITSFNSDLRNLTNGSRMFFGCNNLTIFESDLSNLTNGEYMFLGCKLNKESVINIINCIKEKNVAEGNMYLNLGIDSSFLNDTELESILGISGEATSTNITGHGGATWNITLEWN